MKQIQKLLFRNNVFWASAGIFFFTFSGWKWNMPLASWLFPVFLIRFFRNQSEWYRALLIVPFLFISSYLKFFDTMAGVLDPGIEFLCSLILPLPFLVSLFLDRCVYKKLKGWPVLLVYPAGITLFEYLVGSIPSFGTSGSLAVTQFYNTEILQSLSVAGIYFIAFILSLSATLINSIIEMKDFSLKRNITKTVFGLLILSVCLAGNFRLALFPATDDMNKIKTVKTAGIVSVHESDYFKIISDAVPKDGSEKYRKIFKEIEGNLMAKSEQAAKGGAKVIFWSEANLFVYQDDLKDFIELAMQFAKEKGVYFAPSIQVLNYGSDVNDNRSIMISPGGEIIYQYNKHKSNYRTESDGVIKYADTPFGRIGTAICFDMDYPAYIRQAGSRNIDILLVPAFDTKGMSPFHTYTGLLRSIENGISVFRMVNEGMSAAVDYQGNIISRQDYFLSNDHILYADLPVKGVNTLYSYAGDWFVWICVIFIIITVYFLFRKKYRQ